MASSANKAGVVASVLGLASRKRADTSCQLTISDGFFGICAESVKGDVIASVAALTSCALARMGQQTSATGNELLVKLARLYAGSNKLPNQESRKGRRPQEA